MFSQKKMASVKAQIPGDEIKNGRDAATLQVTQKQLNSPGSLNKLQSVSWSNYTSCLLKESYVSSVGDEAEIHLLKSVGTSARAEAQNRIKTGFKTSPWLWVVSGDCFWLFSGVVFEFFLMDTE